MWDPKKKKKDKQILPIIDAGTAKAAAACILILKFDESRSNSKRILKTEGALQKVEYKHYLKKGYNIA